jgi:hypothetical protein
MIYTSQGGTNEGNAADDALPVIRGRARSLTPLTRSPILPGNRFLSTDFDRSGRSVPSEEFGTREPGFGLTPEGFYLAGISRPTEYWMTGVMEWSDEKKLPNGYGGIPCPPFQESHGCLSFFQYSDTPILFFAMPAVSDPGTSKISAQLGGKRVEFSIL